MSDIAKSQLIKEIAEHCEESQASVAKVLDSYVAFVTYHVQCGDKVGLPDHGKFEAAATQARTARNPHTGAEIAVAASHRVKFKPSTAFKNAAKAIA